MNTRSKRMIHGVPGPAGEPGVLLLVPRSEALDWDLKDEVASTGRYWMADREAWWVAAPYAATAAAIVARVHGPLEPLEEVGAPDSNGWRLARRQPLRAMTSLGRFALLRLQELLRRVPTRQDAGRV